jgi:hypothetical protein
MTHGQIGPAERNRAPGRPIKAKLMLVDANSGTSAANVTGAIRQASKLTGTSFQYLLATAKVESNFNPNASVATSSARGLFQFIDQTWLSTMKEQGASLGYGQYANAIEKTSSGNYAVADVGMRDKIMKLRQDPTANAVMAGAFTRNNAAKLATRLGRPPTEGELYIAHFLGVGGAAKLIGHAATNPKDSAAALFPSAAKANRSIFYDRDGAARSVAQVTGVLVGKYAVARAAPVAPPQLVAAAAPAAPAAAEVKAPAFLSYFPAPAGAPDAISSPPLRGTLQQADASGGDRRQAIAPAVQELWGRPPQAPVAQTASAAPMGGAPLDLFGDGRRNVRGLFTGT